jgi:hypothetical protein
VYGFRNPVIFHARRFSGPWFPVAAKAASLELSVPMICVDTSSTYQNGKSNECLGLFSTVLAVSAFGALVWVQVVELKKSRCDAAGIEEERRDVD